MLLHRFLAAAVNKSIQVFPGYSPPAADFAEPKRIRKHPLPAHALRGEQADVQRGGDMKWLQDLRENPLGIGHIQSVAHVYRGLQRFAARRSKW